MSSHVFLVFVLLPFLLFVGRIYTNHTYDGSFLKFGHITGEIFTTSESLFMSADSCHPPTQLRNGRDKNDSNNGNEHVGMQKRC